MKRINIGYPLYFEKSEYRSTALDNFCSGLKPDEFCKVWHFPIACLRLGGGDLNTPREALKSALKSFIASDFDYECGCIDCSIAGEPTH